MIWTGSDILYLDPKKLRPDKPREENRVWYLPVYNSNIDLKKYIPIDRLSLKED